MDGADSPDDARLRDRDRRRPVVFADHLRRVSLDGSVVGTSQRAFRLRLLLLDLVSNSILH